MEGKNQWLEWAKELQDLSQCALAYCKDKFDIERFERIREISAEMAAAVVDMPVETVKGMFCAGTGYQTARIETRAAVMRDGKLDRSGEHRQGGPRGGRHDRQGNADNRAARLSPPQHEQGPIPL